MTHNGAGYGAAARGGGSGKAGGFREARMSGSNPSRLSDAVRRAEQQLGVRLFNRTTRTVVLTEAGRALMSRLLPAMNEVDAALDALNTFRDTPGGTLRLNVPVSAARLVLPAIVPGFCSAIRTSGWRLWRKVMCRTFFAIAAMPVSVMTIILSRIWWRCRLGRACSAAAAAAPAYGGLRYAAASARPDAASLSVWPLCHRRDGRMGVQPRRERITLQPGPLICSIGAAMDLTVSTAIAGAGVVYLFEDWLKPALANGSLQPVLADWWLSFPGLWLYYNDRRLIPAPLQAFLSWIRELNAAQG